MATYMTWTDWMAAAYIIAGVWLLVWLLPMVYYAYVCSRVPFSRETMLKHVHALEQYVAFEARRYIAIPRKTLYYLALGCVLSSMYISIKTNFTTILL